jgi:hypothetical protein
MLSLSMAGIFCNRKIFYRTASDPAVSPNRFASIALLQTLNDTFEVTEREGDTAPEPFQGEDEVAQVNGFDNYEAARTYFEAQCRRLVLNGWIEYKDIISQGA